MSDKTLTQQIKMLLKDEMLKNTLVPQALQEMLDALDSNEIVIKDQEETIEALNAAEKKIREEYQGVKAARDDYLVELTELKNRIEDLEAREKNCLEVEIRNQFEQKRGDEMREIVGLVFQNRTIRETTVGEQFTAVPGSRDCIGYVQRDPGVKTETTKTEE